MITSTMIPSTAEFQAGNRDIRTIMLIFIRRTLTVQAVAVTGLALKKKMDGHPVPHDEKPTGNIPGKEICRGNGMRFSQILNRMNRSIGGVMNKYDIVL